MKEEGISADLMKLISPNQPKGFYAANMDLDKILGLYPQINEVMMKDGCSGEMTKPVAETRLLKSKKMNEVRTRSDG